MIGQGSTNSVKELTVNEELICTCCKTSELFKSLANTSCHFLKKENALHQYLLALVRTSR